MNAEDLSFDDSTNTEIVKDLSAVFPGVSIAVLPDCFIVETVNSCNLSCFMVTSKESDMSGVLKLEAEEKLEGFH